jgi:hypothetical protein
MLFSGSVFMELFFLFEKYVPEKIAGEKEAGDEDRNEEWGKFDE